MARMIIAGASEANRDQMSRLLASSGYSVYRCCASGSGLRRALAESEDSIVIYLGQLPDCKPDDLEWDYGERVQILVIARPAVLEDCESSEIFRLALPTTGQAILGALEMLNQLHRMKMPKRMGAERQIVEQAKEILMKQLNITEPEAHHLLQKQAMDHSIKMAEYAARIVEQAQRKR
ncbi:MAG: ANTAR domain-containing protein [Clostridia bacterium]|nr:ANTAR domain-containing protein [Clostridia bacterium]